MGWSCTEREITAVERVPEDAWVPGIDQDGELLEGVRVADITALLETSAWTDGIRVIVREEPLHPKYAKRASEREKNLGKRYQLIATNTRVGQIAWLDARHRCHVHVESDIKQLKDLGLDKWPSKSWDFNVAWTQIVALAANLLACFRHLALHHDPELRRATPKTLRHRIIALPARLTRGQRKRYLHLRADWPWTTDLLTAWQAIKNLTPPT